MTYKYKTSNGLSAFGLGLLGGALLWWGLRRRMAAAAEPFRLQVPASQKSRPRREEHTAQVTASTAETTWPDEAVPPTRSQSENRAKVQTTQKAEPSSSPPEDFTPIEGVGPKINEVLHKAGITTFAQLAETEVSELGQILGEAGLRLAQADTWPEQAKLAAEGKWEELKRLQDELDGGRRLSP